MVDVRTFQLFEGSTRLHKATCAEGERYSLVIFSICEKGILQLTDAMRAELQEPFF